MKSCYQKINPVSDKGKNDILKAMNRGEITLAVLVDFSKAFDTVDFEILMKKLHSLRFSKNTHDIVKLSQSP